MLRLWLHCRLMRPRCRMPSAPQHDHLRDRPINITNETFYQSSNRFSIIYLKRMKAYFLLTCRFGWCIDDPANGQCVQFPTGIWMKDWWFLIGYGDIIQWCGHTWFPSGNNIDMWAFMWLILKSSLISANINFARFISIDILSAVASLLMLIHIIIRQWRTIYFNCAIHTNVEDWIPSLLEENINPSLLFRCYWMMETMRTATNITNIK